MVTSVSIVESHKVLTELVAFMYSCCWCSKEKKKHIDDGALPLAAPPTPSKNTALCIFRGLKKKKSKTPACTFLGPLGRGTGALPVPARYSSNPLKLSAGVPFMRSRYKQVQSLPQVPVTLTTTLFTGLWVRSSEFRLNA